MLTTAASRRNLLSYFFSRGKEKISLIQLQNGFSPKRGIEITKRKKCKEKKVWGKKLGKKIILRLWYAHPHTHLLYVHWRSLSLYWGFVSWEIMRVSFDCSIVSPPGIEFWCYAILCPFCVKPPQSFCIFFLLSSHTIIVIIIIRTVVVAFTQLFTIEIYQQSVIIFTQEKRRRIVTDFFSLWKWRKSVKK